MLAWDPRLIIPTSNLSGSAPGVAAILVELSYAPENQKYELPKEFISVDRAEFGFASCSVIQQDRVSLNSLTRPFQTGVWVTLGVTLFVTILVVSSVLLLKL